MAVRLEVNVGGELHGAVWKAVRHAMLALTLVVIGVGVVLVPGELVEALHTEMLDLMAGGLGRILGFGHAGDHLCEDAAQDGLTFGVWGVWRNGDSLDGVEDELIIVYFQLSKRMMGVKAYASILFFDSCDLDIVDLDHLPIKTHDGHKDSDERVVFEFLLVILYAVAESQVAVVTLHVG